jgi:4-diphosphocytidyl-2-C-methyl-D-erythritol kinase
MQKITIKSPAKINLGLQVLNKRQDGYHNINTVFAKISLFDIIEFQPSNETLIRTEPDLGIPREQNLVYQAIELYREKFGIKESLSAVIKKNIPPGGGLGGGSSNAASALIAMSETYPSANLQELRQLAEKLGSDVPFFLQKGIAEGKSKGEKLDYLEMEMHPLFEWNVFIVNPGIEVSTPVAYKSLGRGIGEIPETNFAGEIRKANLKEFKNKIYNDFENSVFRLHPEIGLIKEELYKSGAAFTLMSGSGSSVFGIFENEMPAELSEKFSGFFCKQVKIIL